MPTLPASFIQVNTEENMTLVESIFTNHNWQEQAFLLLVAPIHYNAMYILNKQLSAADHFILQSTIISR